MIAGAGAAYLGGGLGGWEIVFCVLLTFMAYRGLSDYRYIGTAWVLHTCWDVLHDLYANPIIPFVQTSSTGCAICDLVLAAWYFLGAPSIYRLAACACQSASEVTSAMRSPSSEYVPDGARAYRMA